jgi:hypothetical protein
MLRNVSIYFISVAYLGLVGAFSTAQTQESPERVKAVQRGLLAHWPLDGNALDRSPHARHGKVVGNLRWSPADSPNGASAEFNGRDAYIEIPTGLAPRLKTSDFTIAAWISVDHALDDVPGDIISQYDAALKRGYHLTLKTNAGVTTTQPNLRQLQFGIDNARDTEWLDCGRPGNATLAFALTSFGGHLWAGTSHPGKDEVGRVYRYEQDKKWTDCGAPVKCNSVTALAEFDGHLYAGTGKYRFGGSALAESENTHLGGDVLRYEGEQRWTDCGTLPGVEAIGGMVVFRNRLYASSLYKPAGFFRYEGGTRWTALPTPVLRVEALGVYNGYLYATSYDGGQVFRFDGDAWDECGTLGGINENSQTYSFAVHAGRLFVGTWPSGKVYRFEEVNRWKDVGRLGEELEVMGMLVHNGRLLAGTLPLADVYEYAGESQWKKLTRLDHTPDVKYRRAWTMAEFDGRVFCSTLPSGRIYSYQAGASVMSGSALPAGWRHVAAVKQGDRLQLYVDGKQVARSTPLDSTQYDLNVDKPLQIGFGQNDFFLGRMRDVRIYDRALEIAELEALAR